MALTAINRHIRNTMDKKNVSDSLFMIEFAEQTQPTFLAQKNKDWVLVGEKNDYFKYLIDLFNRNAEHNAIISAKTIPKLKTLNNKLS